VNSMLAQIHSLPSLIREDFGRLEDSARAALEGPEAREIERLYLTGCGDSHHAALSAEFAFEVLTGLPTEALTAMQFARYSSLQLSRVGGHKCLAVGISVSGEVARTVEASNLAQEAGAFTVAVTATPGSRLAQCAERTLLTSVAPIPDPPAPTPGIRSYAASQLGLLALAVRLGEVRGHLGVEEAAVLRREIVGMADASEVVISACELRAKALAEEWSDAQEFVFLGSGPNYGTALFSAAKMLEASGDSALGQDLEEWAHLQYFARTVATPTFVITAGERDLTRAVEVTVAAGTIGRRVAAVCPPSDVGVVGAAARLLPLPNGVREVFSPVIAAIPGELFAAYRAELLGEPYFRAFDGGRSLVEGGGISRIRSSEM